MSKYLLLLKLKRAELLDTIDILRKIPRKSNPEVEIEYIMNIFGMWHVAIWFSSQDSAKAIDFVNTKVSKIPGVIDAFPVATFPHKDSEGSS